VKAESKKPAMYKTLSMSCDQELLDRVAAIARRDGTTRCDAARQMIEFALPHYEKEAQQ
jgi:hypothetical protein